MTQLQFSNLERRRGFTPRWLLWINGGTTLGRRQTMAPQAVSSGLRDVIRGHGRRGGRPSKGAEAIRGEANIRRIGLHLLAFAVLSIPGFSRPATRPNVLLIVVDDARTALRCFDDKTAITPNLDRLAQHGVRFENAYCQEALCNASRSSLLTGQRPNTLKVWDQETWFRTKNPDVVTLPGYFKQHGYFTRSIGKIFNNWHQNVHPNMDSWSVPPEYNWGTHNADAAQVAGAMPPNLATLRKTECRNVPDDAYRDGRIARDAMEALRKLKETDQPFFLAVGFWKPHFPAVHCP